MQINQTNIAGCREIILDQHEDDRGILVEGFVEGLVPDFECVQSNIVSNKDFKGTKAILRGIHRSPFRKIVTCVSGLIYDVCIDLRKYSPTYRQHFGTWLNPFSSLVIPAYCGHGYAVSDASIVVYYQDGIWNPSTEININPLDPEIEFIWDEFLGPFVMSDKDRNAPLLKEVESRIFEEDISDAINSRA